MKSIMRIKVSHFFLIVKNKILKIQITQKRFHNYSLQQEINEFRPRFINEEGFQ